MVICPLMPHIIVSKYYNTPGREKGKILISQTRSEFIPHMPDKWLKRSKYTYNQERKIGQSGRDQEWSSLLLLQMPIMPSFTSVAERYPDVMTSFYETKLEEKKADR